MDRWDVLWYIFAAYLAVVALVRLANRRRTQLAAELLAEAEAQRPKKKKKPGQ